MTPHYYRFMLINYSRQLPLLTLYLFMISVLKKNWYSRNFKHLLSFDWLNSFLPLGIDYYFYVMLHEACHLIIEAGNVGTFPMSCTHSHNLKKIHHLPQIQHLHLHHRDMICHHFPGTSIRLSPPDVKESLCKWVSLTIIDLLS